ncbi:MAG: AMP-binding protein [Pseudomonadota bacterium]
MSGEAVDWSSSREAIAATGMAIAAHAMAAPERTAIIAAPGNRTFGELNGHANQLVRGLRARGLGPHSGVALICSNRAEFMEVYAACMRAGFILTPVNWHLTGDEMAYIVGNCEAKAVIAESRFAAAAAQAASASSHVDIKLAVGGPIEGFTDYETFLAAHDAANIVDPTLGSPMLYTSGTTGNPKGVYRWPPRPSDALRSIMDRMLTFAPDNDLCLLTGPAYHAAPLQLNAVASLAFGVGLVMMDKWDAEETLRLIDKHRIVYTHMVATMFTRMLRLPEDVRNRYDLSSIKAVIHGAAPCPKHVKQAMIDWFGPVFFEYYAATEGGATLASSHDWLARPGTVGQPIGDSHFRVLDDQLNERDAGVEGTVYIRAPDDGGFVYFKSREKTDASYHGNYFTLGDHGYLDADGYLFLTGRHAELIISGGVNIYPQEVDDVLLELEVVHDACTIGVPDEEWGEAVKAVVQLAEGTAPSEALAAELLEHCRAHLAAFKCPRSIEFQTGLPRLPSGKIQRHKVRAPFWVGHEQN